MDKLLLLSGNDIPFPMERITIHQPTLKEIGYIGERKFFTGCELLTFTKNNLNSVDRKRLQEYKDFDIIMLMLKSKEKQAQINRYAILSVLTLLFPIYQVSLDFKNNQIKLVQLENQEEYKIDNKSFQSFQEIIVKIFCLEGKKETTYNTQGALANKIADKLRQGRQKAAQAKGKTEDIHVLAQYISILTVGLSMSMNDILSLTVPQLYDVYKRYEMKLQYDIYVKQKLAGAKDLKDVDFWMKDIY